MHFFCMVQIYQTWCLCYSLRFFLHRIHYRFLQNRDFCCVLVAFCNTRVCRRQHQLLRACFQSTHLFCWKMFNEFFNLHGNPSFGIFQIRVLNCVSRDDSWESTKVKLPELSSSFEKHLTPETWRTSSSVIIGYRVLMMELLSCMGQVFLMMACWRQQTNSPTQFIRLPWW